MSCKSIEELKADLLTLGQQSIAMQGAMQYIQQQIALLEKQEQEEKEAAKKSKEGKS